MSHAPTSASASSAGWARSRWPRQPEPHRCAPPRVDGRWRNERPAPLQRPHPRRGEDHALACEHCGHSHALSLHLGLSDACSYAQMLQSALERRRCAAAAAAATIERRTWHSSTRGRASSRTRGRPKPLPHGAGFAAHSGGIEPGQFVHMKVPNMEAHILRRPFSVYARDAAAGRSRSSTRPWASAPSHDSHRARAREHLSGAELIGPVGRAWEPPADARRAPRGGGVGAAPLFMLTERSWAPACARTS